MHDIIDHIFKGQNINYSSDALDPIGDNIRLINLTENGNSHFAEMFNFGDLKDTITHATSSLKYLKKILSELIISLSENLQEKIKKLMIDTDKPNYDSFTKEEMTQINGVFLQENRMQVYRYFLSKIMHKYMVIKLQVANNAFRGNAKVALKTEEIRMRNEIRKLDDSFKSFPNAFNTHGDYYKMFIDPNIPDFEKDIMGRVEVLGVLGEKLFLENPRFKRLVFEMYGEQIKKYNNEVNEEYSLKL